jgi:hypothetical protein
MYWTSLTPTSLSVPPYFGAPVPGLIAWKPAVVPVPVPVPVDDDDGPGWPLVLDELLHAAASTVRATAPATAPAVRKRKCLTTLLLLQNLLSEDRS